MDPSVVAGIVSKQAAAELPGVVELAPTPAAATLAMPDGRTYTYPLNHVPGTIVPKGGSSCGNCRFSVVDAPGGATCTNPDFIAAELPGKPSGTGLLPAPSDEYCSDWWSVSLPNT